MAAESVQGVALLDKMLMTELQARGLISQLAGGDELVEHLCTGSRTVYCGFDPTADSLHIGSLVPLLALRRFQLAGHRPLVLVGGATGLIGDPSFKAEERRLNSPEIVNGWAARIEAQVARFLDLDTSTDNRAVIVNNYDWLGQLGLLEFLRDIGKHFSVSAMMSKESVRQRLDREGAGISFTEFTYSILQAFDFSELFSREGCTVQLGGSDQWGNITAGIELTRRRCHGQTYGATFPLVVKADGSKFGKTESGTVWLDPKRTSPYAFYQFWMSTADADVYNFLKYFTFLSVSEIARIEETDAASQGRRSGQAILAQEVTRLVHGAEALEDARRISKVLFSGDVSALTEDDFAQIALGGLSVLSIDGAAVALVDALVGLGLALTPRGEVTTGQARKFVQEGAVQVNGVKVTDAAQILSRGSSLWGRYHLLRRGKKQFALLIWN